MNESQTEQNVVIKTPVLKMTIQVKSKKRISIKRQCSCGNDFRCCRIIDAEYCH